VSEWKSKKKSAEDGEEPKEEVISLVCNSGLHTLVPVTGLELSRSPRFAFSRKIFDLFLDGWTTCATHSLTHSLTESVKRRMDMFVLAILGLWCVGVSEGVGSFVQRVVEQSGVRSAGFEACRAKGECFR
jgi:hypothetical protein